MHIKLGCLLVALVALILIQATAATKHSPAARFTSYEERFMCGYQGWFRAPGDGSDRGWMHHGTKGKFDPTTMTMFDEMNEGTAIFKCTDEPPTNSSPSKFLTCEGLSSDHYLWLTGQAGGSCEIKPASIRNFICTPPTIC